MEKALRLYKVSIIVLRNERFNLNIQMIEKFFDFQHIDNNCQFLRLSNKNSIKVQGDLRCSRKANISCCSTSGTCHVPLVRNHERRRGQELLTLLENMSSPPGF
jgi:hypothetical protein